MSKTPKDLIIFCPPVPHRVLFLRYLITENEPMAKIVIHSLIVVLILDGIIVKINYPQFLPGPLEPRQGQLLAHGPYFKKNTDLS